ncbi:MAG: MinD/ParA family ATP-binding protein [Desulfomonilia bacterium]
MDEKSRLGRGLKDVSRFYLSESPREEPQEEPGEEARGKEPDPALSLPRQRRVVRVICPASTLMGAFFTANFSLELARHRQQAAVFDMSGREGERVQDMLGEVARPAPTSGVLWVRLYGLHGIPVHCSGPDGEAELSERLNGPDDHQGDRWTVINAPFRLDSLAKSLVDFDALLLSTLDEASLLQCYACTKVIEQRDPQARVSLVLMEPASDEQARGVFSRFCAFAKQRLGVSVGYLGHVLRDQALEDSLSGHRPLVLGLEPSSARESLTAVSRAFLEQRGLPVLGEGGRP